MKSLRTKIILLVGLTALLTAFSVGGLFYKEISKQAYDNEVATLAMETRLMAPLFQSAFNGMQDNIRFLHETPPIQGIIRAERGGGQDTEDASSTQAWKARLATIFTSLLQRNPSYAQVRYISADKQGLEIVRVERTVQGIITVAEENLQQKGKEPYFQTGLTLEPQSVYFSMITMNREHGEVEFPLKPVIRAVMPVYDHNGTIYGMIVINALYEEILKTVLRNLTLPHDLYVINANGDYLYYEAQSRLWDFFRRAELETLPPSPLVQAVIGQEQKERTFIYRASEGTEIVTHSLLVPYHTSGQKYNHLILALTMPKHALLENSEKIRINAALLAVSLMLSACFIASLFSYGFIRPLGRIIQALRRYDDESVAPVLPIHSKDEIGELSRAFQEMSLNLKKLRHNEKLALNRLQKILDNASDGILSLNSSGQIEEYNKACIGLFGYQSEEVIGKNVSILLSPTYGERASSLEEIAKAESQNGTLHELDAQHKNGKIFPVEFSLNKVELNEGFIYSCLIRDISERKNEEQRILRSNEDLERFAYVASHDLKEPLRTINVLSGMLRHHLGEELDEKSTQYMQLIEQASERMKNLINDLLEYSRINTAEDIVYSAFPPKKTLDHVLDALKERVEESGAVIKAESLPAKIISNPDRFYRIMLNLISNALKFKQEGKDLKITIACKEGADEWIFSIKDNGIGIEREYHQLIFGFLKKVHRKNEYAGSGIGLNATKRILETLNGDIWLESEPGQGTVFYFSLPKNLSK